MTFEIEILDPKIISVNDIYMHPVRKCKNGRYVSYFCKSPGLKVLQEFYKRELSIKIPEEVVNEFKEYIKQDKSHSIKLILEFGMPESDIYSQDASNLIKAIEDCISTRFKIDDKYHTEVTSIKSIYNSFTKNWMLKITYATTEIKLYERLNKNV